MIREIKEYIKERKSISLEQLIIHTKMESSALMPILTKLENKKTIELFKPSCASGGCSGCECAASSIEIKFI